MQNEPSGYLPHIAVTFDITNGATDVHCATICIDGATDDVIDDCSLFHFQCATLKPYGTCRTTETFFCTCNFCSLGSIYYNTAFVTNFTAIFHSQGTTRHTNR